MSTQNSDHFETGCDYIEVTSLHRPDTSWRYMDRNGHEHRWHTASGPTTSYRPESSYDVPTLVWMFERWGYYPDGTRYEVGHHACKECGEQPIVPAYTADDCQQYVPGLRWYRINGRHVSPEEYLRRFKEQYPPAPDGTILA